MIIEEFFGNDTKTIFDSLEDIDFSYLDYFEKLSKISLQLGKKQLTQNNCITRYYCKKNCQSK